MWAVEIENLNKTIRGREVLKDINLRLQPEMIYGFFGRNGSGKTMLFRTICGLIRPSTGTVRVFGKTLGIEISFPESLGVIIETVGLWPHLTGLQNLRLLATIKGSIGDKEITDAIVRVGLDPKDHRNYGKYSLGMKQRLGMAQAIMEKPDLIVLDEPTNSLDDEGVLLCRNILQQEKERGATILLATHIRDDLEFLSDQKFRMDNGYLTKYQERVL